jgi:aminoglycoside/choline kinase family phosphotransferase
MNETIQNNLVELFETTFEEKVIQIEHIPASASDRRYVRMASENRNIIGSYNSNKKENISFVAFTKHFIKKGIAVPTILAENLEQDIYLLEDLGNQTLLQYLNQERTSEAFPPSVFDLYKKAVQDLAHLQIKGDEDFDYELCSESQQFDKRAMLYDLNAFQFHFLKVVGVVYNIEKLERDFKRLIKSLTKNKGYNYFMFRDFQSRNIMIKEGKPYYIDYQSGRKGALQYDLASLLYQAKANIPQATRNELTDIYIESVSEMIDIDKEHFKKISYTFVLLRTLQVLSTYGYRGFFQRKTHFLVSIPYAINNLEWLLKNKHISKRLPELKSVIRQLTKMQHLRTMNDKYPNGASNLTVTINSFSYKRAIPTDESGNGGGFVFDCRSIHNPGRYEPYKKLTGRDESVQQFLETKSEIPVFLESVFTLVDAAVKKYIDRDFTSLMVSFGCTGGQHRSVYSTDALAKHLQEKFNISVKVNHIEQELKNWIN